MTIYNLHIFLTDIRKNLQWYCIINGIYPTIPSSKQESEPNALREEKNKTH